MKYDVHIYPIFRVKVSGIEANSPAEAAKIAEERCDFHEFNGTQEFAAINPPTQKPDGLLIAQNMVLDYAEDIDSFLVDEVEQHGDKVNVVKSFDLNNDFNQLDP